MIKNNMNYILEVVIIFSVTALILTSRTVYITKALGIGVVIVATYINKKRKNKLD